MKDWQVFLLMIATSLVASGIAATGAKRSGYMQGQIDALTGKVKYELRVNADSTRTWVEVKK